jgi:Cu2+-exporting ATPase
VEQVCAPAQFLRREVRACLHCGLSLEPSETGDFCCIGCASVHALLHEEHLESYYALRGGRGAPVADRSHARRDSKWLEPIEARVAAGQGPQRVTLDIQGLHCVGCVWLIETLFARADGGENVVVNPALGRVDLVVSPGFDLRGFVEGVERFGYLLGPPIKRAVAASGDLVWRLGVCVAIAMNSMIFAIAIYAGLDRGPLYELFTRLNFGLGALAVAVGGTVFFRSAWRACERRVLHLDLPIAAGIALAFGGSAWLQVAHRAQATYFDTLDVFIALMLLGRYLQERAVERNRAWLLATDGADGLLVRRLRDGRPDLVTCRELQRGDRLLLAPGDLLPVDALLERGADAFSLDWIVGESRPRSYGVGDVVPAGAFASGREASVLCAVDGFDASPLKDLLRTPDRAPADTPRATPWFQRLARVYVVAVLALAGLTLAGWLLLTGDLPRALSATTSVLIVTCPCAFGIAVPLAYEIAQARLRASGLFVRRASLLDRARDVRRVVFDKTGTLTTGTLVVEDASALAQLTAEDRAALYDMTARSGHPKSAAIKTALELPTPGALHARVRLREDSTVTEHAGFGLELCRDGRRWRLGEPGWVAPGTPRSCDVAFGADGVVLATIETTEQLRPDAAREVRALAADGYEVWLLSGDSQDRVDACARVAGIAPERAIGDAGPHDKAAFLDRHGRGETLFVGDGVNDALALDHAHASGTPAVDRPFVPARADFFFVTAGLSPVRQMLRSARALAQVVRADLRIALAYNAVAVALAVSGLMSPLLCAVLMPASSLTTIAATIAALSPRSRPWKS